MVQSKKQYVSINHLLSKLFFWEKETMASTSNEPSYNLKAVVRETGLKPDTLRAWERRYGLPQPNRTAGGHRLYSKQDINILKWLVSRQKEGLSISRAVELWRQLEAEGQSPIVQTSFPGSFADKPSIAPASGPTLEQLRDDWVDACLEFDERTAENILTQAFALYPPEVVCNELLLPALSKIGEGWYQGDFTVQQEHFASALAARRLEALLVATPAPTRPERILVGCPPQEEHTFGALLLSLFLRRQGWDVVYLGANIPLAQMEVTIASTRPQLVILSAQRLPTAATLQEMAQFLHDKQIPVAFGGNIFDNLPNLQKRIPSHYLGANLDEGTHLVEHLITAKPPVPVVEPIPEIYQQALVHYSQRQPVVEASVWELLRGSGIYEHHLSVASYNISRNIIAALTLGDMDFLRSEVAWVTNLLVNRQLSPSLLCIYFEAYLKAAQEKLDERGAPVIAWLAQVVSNCDQMVLEAAQ
jgi:DNA-binding transcriptional MerR regulator/methylmalonyl-CoA mutase cobalamin-binding subunit